MLERGAGIGRHEALAGVDLEGRAGQVLGDGVVELDGEARALVEADARKTRLESA